MTTENTIQLLVLAVAILAYVLSRRQDLRARQAENASRAQNEIRQHQQTRDQIRDLTHALELRVQSTEGTVDRHSTLIDRHDVKLMQLEKDVIGIQATLRK